MKAKEDMKVKEVFKKIQLTKIEETQEKNKAKEKLREEEEKKKKIEEEENRKKRENEKIIAQKTGAWQSRISQATLLKEEENKRHKAQMAKYQERLHSRERIAKVRQEQLKKRSERRKEQFGMVLGSADMTNKIKERQTFNKFFEKEKQEEETKQKTKEMRNRQIERLKQKVSN